MDMRLCLIHISWYPHSCPWDFKKGMCMRKKVREKIKEIVRDESGMGVIEIVLIILVLVGLALVFKSQISSVANGVYDSISCLLYTSRKFVAKATALGARVPRAKLFVL